MKTFKEYLNESLNTKRDKDGNYTGEYKGVEFKIYAISNEWPFIINYFSKTMDQIETYSSTEDIPDMKTKKLSMLALKDTIDNKDYM